MGALSKPPHNIQKLLFRKDILRSRTLSTGFLSLQNNNNSSRIHSNTHNTMKLSTNISLIVAAAIANKGVNAFAPQQRASFGVLSSSSSVEQTTALFGKAKRKAKRKKNALKKIQKLSTSVKSSVNAATGPNPKGESSYTPPVPSDTISKEEVRALFSLWNDALATGDSRIVASRYTKSPVLLPTVSDVPRTDYDSVKDYFDSFLKKQPQGEILDGHITIGENGDWASDTGIYEFTMGIDGSKVKGRYSYIYVKEDGIWKINHHHSSVMPEEIAMGKAITEDEVKGLFHLWNDALATLDSKTVASRYAKEGVLLPTVSDTPRTGECL